jgi:hypothetical protein
LYGVALTGHAKTAWDMAHIHLGEVRVHIAVEKEAIEWISKQLK